MPELPEVETIRRGLSDFCLNKKVVRVRVLCEKSFVGPVEAVEGASIIGFRRRGKALLIDLSNGVTMMIHLRMTGQLIYVKEPSSALADARFAHRTLSTARSSAPAALNLEPLRKSGAERFAGGHPSDSFFEELPNGQTRVVFEFEEGTLYFNDQRKFGFVKPIPTDEVERDRFIASLAPEPWEMTGEELYAKLQRRKNSPIKAVILDQKVVAGIGNIYADEALFYAKVFPGRLAGSLSLAEASAVLEGARKTMEASIESGGSTMATYVRADGTRGNYLEKFAQVFRREGEACPRCGAEILKMRVAGRGTHYCAECQPRDFSSEGKFRRKESSKVKKPKSAASGFLMEDKK